MQIYLETTEILKRGNWQFIFTDGSKNENGVGFAIIKEPDQLLSHGIMPSWFSIFDAETQAVLKSLEIISTLRGKYVVLTDSLSVFNAARNMNTKQEQIIKIQQLLIKMKNKAKLMWIPGHTGIIGNENADEEAKAAIRSPTLVNIPISTKIIKTIASKHFYDRENIKWAQYKHNYKTINPQGKALKLPSTSKMAMNRCFTRLRLGHTNLTNSYIFKKDPPPICQFCNSQQLTTHHIFECAANQQLKSTFFNNNNTTEILADSSIKNIENIYLFLTNLNIHNKI
jgi:ribonuclease HI